jgi:cytoplasmic FMR1 interacting protein
VLLKFAKIALQVQVPLHHSLPWLLVEHALSHPTSVNIQNILFPLDIYNDAAEKALSVFNQRHLFSEVEAEVCVVRLSLDN